MEGGVQKANKEEFTVFWRTIWERPYIMRLAASAGLGGLLFGYDTGVISGALLYIRDDFKSVDRHTWLQETIVSTAVAGAIVGAAIGGLVNDRFGRKKSILLADFLFFIGAVVMAASPSPAVILVGRLFVGLGVGMASMTAPLYISEASPASIRGALVSTNGLLITGGQFLSYLINLAFTKAPGTWRWMLGVAGVPALFQFILMIFLPESPRWLYRKNKVEEAKAILEKIYPAEEVDEQIKALEISLEAEKAEKVNSTGGFFSNLKGALSNMVVRRGLYAGITVQVAQQFCGINTVMYYSPTIVQLAGFASNRTALALSLVTSGLNALGSIVSMVFVDRYGRRRLMLISMTGIIVCLCVLSVLFFEASAHSPHVSFSDSNSFGDYSTTCSTFITSNTSANASSSWNCMKCLKASSGCAFCTNGMNKYDPGACLAKEKVVKEACRAGGRVWYTQGCPSKFGYLAIIILGLYIISYAPGMGTVPWIVNSEIYPLRYRGIGGGIAAVSNWISNLIVSETFLTLTKALGSASTFLLFAGFSFMGLVAIFFLVPETKGLQFEEVERLLDKGHSPVSCFSRKEDAEKEQIKDDEEKEQVKKDDAEQVKELIAEEPRKSDNVL